MLVKSRAVEVGPNFDIWLPLILTYGTVLTTIWYAANNPLVLILDQEEVEHCENASQVSSFQSKGSSHVYVSFWLVFVFGSS